MNGQHAERRPANAAVPPGPDGPAVNLNATSPQDVLWAPTEYVLTRSVAGRYMAWLAERGLAFDSYHDMWEWSVTDLPGFWRSVWEFFDIRSAQPFTEVMSDAPMPDTTWFAGAKVNYAEHALRRSGPELALLGRSHTRGPVDVSFGQLREDVARARTGLLKRGVRPGDSVVALMPNIPECVTVFLAAASIGATFASCAPEFGLPSIAQRFGQLKPKVLVAVDGYRYRGKAIDKRDTVAGLRQALPDLIATVALPFLADEPIDGCTSWADFMAEQGPLEFESVDADHPLYVLFSSGTTGAPKAIVHGHGRILVEHLKVLGLHQDLGPDDRLLVPATTAWMVWNFSVSALMLGAGVVCFDGDPLWPDPMEMWRVAEQTRATIVNCGAQILLQQMKLGQRPGDSFDLSHLRSIGSTGSPLPADAFRWVYDAIKRDLLLSSGSGGTDVCSGFVGGSPLLPVTAGEIACRYLGSPVEAFGPDGAPVRNEPGELVLTAPMPSMPVEFLGDPDKSAYRASYFEMFPGVWRHGDWITITDRGTCTIDGRSDATLNRAGIRLGTAEYYSLIETIPEVSDCLVVYLEDGAGEPGTLLLLIAPEAGSTLGDRDSDRIKKLVRTELSPRHVPDHIFYVEALPRTLTGKRLELPVKKILKGASITSSLSVDAVTSPESVQAIKMLAERAPWRSSMGTPGR